MKTLLVPTDFTPTAHVAGQYAACLAAHTGSKLVLFHCVPIQVAVAEVPAWYEPEQGLLEYYQDKLSQQARQLQQDNGNRFEVEAVCRKGSLAQHFNEVVQENAADLVVMGFDGASSWLDKILGTVTSSYIKDTVCPVLMVPGQVVAALPRRVAYAADFAHPEEVFLAQLLEMTTPLQAQISIVHVQNRPHPDLAAEEKALQAINQAFPDNDFAFAEVRQQDVAAGLEAFVAENGMDLLALASRDRSFLESLFHNSVTDRLADHPAVPLLVLPAHPYHLAASVRRHGEITHS